MFSQADKTLDDGRHCTEKMLVVFWENSIQCASHSLVGSVDKIQSDVLGAGVWWCCTNVSMFKKNKPVNKVYPVVNVNSMQYFNLLRSTSRTTDITAQPRMSDNRKYGRNDILFGTRRRLTIAIHSKCTICRRSPKFHRPVFWSYFRV